MIIKNLLGSQEQTLECLVDTGYDGFLVIPIDVYENLEMMSFEIVEDELEGLEDVFIRLSM